MSGYTCSTTACFGGPTQVEPLYVRTSPVLPATVRLSDKTAVPWNVSAYTSLYLLVDEPISKVLSTVGIVD